MGVGMLLWFDVEMIRYTTPLTALPIIPKLWFDVEMIRYTTARSVLKLSTSCGLM